jgi:hypothetical protein
MKKIGIWNDKREAKIITIEHGNETLNTILFPMLKIFIQKVAVVQGLKAAHKMSFRIANILIEKSINYQNFSRTSFHI